MLLEADGFRVGGRKRLVAYSDITHIGSSRLGLAIGTPNDIVRLRRREFAGQDSIDALARELMERVGRTPGGAVQLARMAEIDRLAHAPVPRRAVIAFMLLCVVAFSFQLRDPFVTHAGSFVPSLAGNGEIWRFLTANFLHELYRAPLHIGLNLVSILAFGMMVERVIGSTRTLLVMGASACGAMLGCTLAGYSEVVGASGVAAGLAGALLAIEFSAGRRLPVWWRIPRRLFMAALALQVMVDVMIPYIAAAAHAGGFLAGFVLTRTMVADAVLGRRIGLWGRVGVTAMVVALVLSVAAAGALVRLSPEALERHAVRLLHTRSLGAMQDNAVAWLLATESESSALGLEAASALAERAVERSGRHNPDLLDTLAEVRFAMGDILGALSAIDEAISLTLDEPYFLEQRRRFNGERAAGDRPEPPPGPWPYRVGPEDRRNRDRPALDEDQGVWI